MVQRTTTGRERIWYDSAHASRCLLGTYLKRTGFFTPIETGVKLKQKVLKCTAVQKLEMLFVSLLAGAKTVCQTGTTLRVDPALQAAFGLPGCAGQPGCAGTLDAATEQEVAEVRQAIETVVREHSQAQHHDFGQAMLLLDLDLSPLPASASSEGSTRGYLGRSRSQTGRKLVRVRAAPYQETVWEDVIEGRTVESQPVLAAAVTGTERLLGLDGDTAEAQAKRVRTEWRLDAGWGGETMINGLLERGYQVTGKFKSTARVRKLVQGIAAWEPAKSAGREVAVVPHPVELARSTQQYAVRTPSKKQVDGYYDAVLFTTRQDLPVLAVVDHDDDRAEIEAGLKSDKRGLGLAVLRKHKLAAQKLVVLLVELAHNVLVWSRDWLVEAAPRLAEFGIVRLVQEVWAVPGRVKLIGNRLARVLFRRAHPRAPDVRWGLVGLLAEGQTLGFSG